MAVRPGRIPKLKTGDPLVDHSGYVYVMMRVAGDETDNL